MTEYDGDVKVKVRQSPAVSPFDGVVMEASVDDYMDMSVSFSKDFSGDSDAYSYAYDGSIYSLGGAMELTFLDGSTRILKVAPALNLDFGIEPMNLLFKVKSSLLVEGETSGDVGIDLEGDLLFRTLSSASSTMWKTEGKLPFRLEGNLIDKTENEDR